MHHLKYLVYLLKHKWFVFVAGRRLGVPLWRLIIHDWSKFTPAEWGPYARRFYGGRSNELDKTHDPEEFHRAWTHHWHKNPHHWEHWVTAEGAALQMPGHFVREMVADWMGAGRAKTGGWEVQEWYEKNRSRMRLHPDTEFHVAMLIYPKALWLKGNLIDNPSCETSDRGWR